MKIDLLSPLSADEPDTDVDIRPATVHELPPLPYPENALEPTISATTVATHYGKHHRAYVDNLNRLISGTPYASMSLEQIVITSRQDGDAIFNNAAQAWNHAFYWRSLQAPQLRNTIPLALHALIETSFANLRHLKLEFGAAATQQFGSGWVWLVLEGSHLRITSTSNAETPLYSGVKPLLVIDVWEHAYYLDYRNRRADYVGSVIEHLINWRFAAENLASA